MWFSFTADCSRFLSHGFYEWKNAIGGKIPYSIGMKDDSLGLADLPVNRVAELTPTAWAAPKQLAVESEIR